MAQRNKPLQYKSLNVLIGEGGFEAPVPLLETRRFSKATKCVHMLFYYHRLCIFS